MRALLNRYRGDLDELTRLANRDLRALSLEVSDGRVAASLLAEVLPALTGVYGAAAGALAADWYDEVREAKSIEGSFRARVAELPEVGRTDALARWAVTPLFSDTPDPAAVFDRAGGGLQRIVADAGRETVMGSAIADPAAIGWQRVASGGCGFCRMLADRGAVYSEATVAFGAHDWCRCAAVPAFGGEPLPVKPYAGETSASDADRHRTREWMRDNGYLD